MRPKLADRLVDLFALANITITPGVGRKGGSPKIQIPAKGWRENIQIKNLVSSYTYALENIGSASNEDGVV